MNNKTKIDSLLDLLPSTFNARTNPNWSALASAIGGSDQNITDLISLVRQQFFVKTASRPYLDNLAANVGVSRPSAINMDDTEFRQYIPIISYKPKQVKLILDQLLYIFFFAQSTTAYITSGIGQPFALQNGDGFKYLVDELNTESITFFTGDFTDITNATATEVASAINRQAQYSYAIAEYDSVSKNTYVQIFTNTIGAKGSIRILGGIANASFQFNGFNTLAGLGNNTQWTISVIGQDVTMKWTGGLSPGLINLLIGDVVILNLPGPAGNVGSFVITSIDIGSNTITFQNIFAVAGVYTQTASNQSQFLTPKKNVAYLNSSRAMTWETNQGEITIEMPTSPPVVKRSLIGSAHINGAFSTVIATNSSTSVTLNDATNFPSSGNFWLQPVEEIIETVSIGVTSTQEWNTRLIGPELQVYNYTSRVALSTTGDLTIGTTQINNLASVVGIVKNQQITMAGLPPYTTVVSVIGTTVNVSQPATASAAGETVIFLGNTLSGITPNLPALAVLDSNMAGMAPTGSTVYLTDAIPSSLSRINGPYVWDPLNAPFVLSADTATIEQNIQAGTIIRLLTLDAANTIPATAGFVVFDYGLNNQEGPIKYLYKPSDNTIIVDPSYTFKFNHSIGSAVQLVESMGPHIMSGLGTEYPPYITDPSQARIVIENILESVTSAGIFVNFLINYPEQLYGLFDVYNEQDLGAGEPFSD